MSALERALGLCANPQSAEWGQLTSILRDARAELAEVARLEQASEAAEEEIGLAEDRATRAEAELAAARAREQRLREALALLLERYVGLVVSGDCGYWDAEREDEVIAARAALAAEPAADGRGTRAFPHDFEGSGKRCLACGEPRWMHPSGSLVRFDSAAAGERPANSKNRQAFGTASAAADEPGERPWSHMQIEENGVEIRD